jgi:hypothetical protein
MLAQPFVTPSPILERLIWRKGDTGIGLFSRSDGNFDRLDNISGGACGQNRLISISPLKFLCNNSQLEKCQNFYSMSVD